MLRQNKTLLPGVALRLVNNKYKMTDSMIRAFDAGKSIWCRLSADEVMVCLVQLNMALPEAFVRAGGDVDFKEIVSSWARLFAATIQRSGVK